MEFMDFGSLFGVEGLVNCRIGIWSLNCNRLSIVLCFMYSFVEFSKRLCPVS